MKKPSRDSARIEGFSDAVFAFSATLLVVSLEVPQTYRELVRDLQGFIAFGVSFGALMLIWTVHHAFFRRYHLVDGVTIAVNSILLFVVLFYVYPLKFISRGFVAQFQEGGARSLGMIQSPGELAGLFILYGAGFSAIFICFAFLYLHASRRADDLEMTAEELHEARFLFRHYSIFAVVGILSIALAAFHAGLQIGLPGWIYAILGPACWLHGVRSAKRQPIPSKPVDEPVG